MVMVVWKTKGSTFTRASYSYREPAYMLVTTITFMVKMSAIEFTCML